LQIGPAGSNRSDFRLRPDSDAAIHGMKEEMDFRNLAALAFTGVSATAAWLGDRATFVRPPRNALENLATLTHVFGYRLTSDRLYSDCIAFGFYLVVLLLILSIARKALHRHVIVPQKMKKMMSDLSLHRDLANRYNRSKLGETIL
jgi:hypothetical protein